MTVAAIDDVRSAFRFDPTADLQALDPAATPTGPAAKSAAADRMRGLADELNRLQEALYAEAVGGGRRRLLLVLQGMDTSGKGGVLRSVGGMVNPLGLHIASFKKPTRVEQQHHFLWRIRKQVPKPGIIGIFDRSHYEDVLIVRVEELVPLAEWRGRFDEINAFEAELAGQGVTMVKCCLHISADEQRKRLLARLENPAKRWKYNPADLDARAKWGAYQQAYAEALRRCSTEIAPWYVIPSDRKWYRNWAVAAILRETLAEIAPQFPPPSYDVDAERVRLSEDPLIRADRRPPRG
jgi:PPK2 family polyphosphate:nucleotide phosphotransferase